jgi:hypothetical protein
VLGPLVVTGVWIACDRYDPGALAAVLDERFDVRDSKTVFNQRDPARGETAALSVVSALMGGIPDDGQSLVERLDPGRSRAGFPCVDGGLDLCGAAGVALPVWADREAVRERGSGLQEALRRAGWRRGGIRSAVMCPWELNGSMTDGTSKMDVDLALFLSVAHALRGSRREDGTITCGKVGARSFYADRLGPGVRVLSESRSSSSYDVPRLGRVSFVRDADAGDPLVSMASLVGKLVREVVMEAIFRRAAEMVEGLDRPSGYRDRVTRRFIERTSATLLGAGAPSACIRRVR